jgi:hypothetical protein
MQGFEQEVEHSVLHVFMAVDCSGSMRNHAHMVPKVVDGLVAHLVEQSKLNNQEVRLSVLLFNEAWRYWVYDMDVLRVPSMVGRYVAGGYTALMDATMAILLDMERIPQLGGRHDFLGYVLTDGLHENPENPIIVTPAQLRAKIEGLPENVSFGALVPGDFRAKAAAKSYGFPSTAIADWDVTATDGFEKAVETITTSATRVMKMTSTGQARGTKELYKPTVGKINDAAVEALGMTPVKGSKYDLLTLAPEHVKDKHRIIDFFAENRLPWRLGHNFYELVRDEYISPDKELALVKTGKGAQVVYIDEKIRGLLGLPDDKRVLVAPGLVPGWGIFVQSKNAGRFMRPGRLLIRKA